MLCNFPDLYNCRICPYLFSTPKVVLYFQIDQPFFCKLQTKRNKILKKCSWHYIYRNLINRTDRLVASCSFRACSVKFNYILTFEVEIFSIVETTAWHKQKGKKNVLSHDLQGEDCTIQIPTCHSFVYKMRWEAWSDTWTPLIWKYVAISDLLFKQKSIFKDNGGEFHFTIALALIVKQKLLTLDYTNLPDSQEIRCKYINM